jgi:hypothetical protein
MTRGSGAAASGRCGTFGLLSHTHRIKPLFPVSSSMASRRLAFPRCSIFAQAASAWQGCTDGGVRPVRTRFPPQTTVHSGPFLIVAASATAPVSGEYPLHAIPILFVWSRTSRDYGCVWYPAPFFLYHHACDEASQARRKPSKFSFLPVQL